MTITRAKSGSAQNAPLEAPSELNPPRAGSKTEKLVKMLRKGASLEELVSSLGWAPHSARAAMTGVRKRGYAIDKRTEGNTTVWFIPAA